MITRARRPSHIIFLAGVFLGLAAGTLRAQFNPPQAPTPRKNYAAAYVNPHAPAIDGKLDDPVWAGAGWEGGFIQSRPYEGREPSQKTEFKITYDEHAIYIAVRALDSRTHEIERRISRRDNCGGDTVSVSIDSLFDHLTAYVFTVNACGVKADQMVVNGGMDYSDEHDMSWDPIWDAAAAIDQNGWTAEMSIPFSQLRFGNKELQVWGLQVSRYLFRLSEESEWQPIPRNAPGYVHLYGELRGLRGLASPHQFEIMPYTVGRLKTYRAEPGNPFSTGSDRSLVGGLDGKIGVTSDLTMNFTVNPDFGQVEADPSVVNLTAYETYFEEKRPFFIEGRNILNYQLVGGDGESSSDNLFYSRRIGRYPQYVPDTGAYLEMPEATPILGAFKLTGKTRSGLSIGVLDSLTARESALLSDGGVPYGLPVEPLTNYFVARAQQDYNGGATTLGGMLTSVNRDIRNANLSFLHDAAQTGGLDFFHSWKNKTYYFSLKTIFSRVHGSPEAILATQTSSVRYFQRPDADYLKVDPTRRSLFGTGGSVEIGKQGGGHWQYVAGFTWRSPGLELNDVGFLRQTDQMTEYVWAGYNVYEPAGIFRSYSVNLNQRATWNFGGQTTSNGGNFNAWGQFKNFWSAGLGLNLSAESLSPSSLRGGPSLRQAPLRSLWFNVQTDNRRKIRLSLSASGTERTNGDSEYWSVRPALNIVPSPALTLSFEPHVRGQPERPSVHRDAGVRRREPVHLRRHRPVHLRPDRAAELQPDARPVGPALRHAVRFGRQVLGLQAHHRLPVEGPGRALSGFRAGPAGLQPRGGDLCCGRRPRRSGRLQLHQPRVQFPGDAVESRHPLGIHPRLDSVCRLVAGPDGVGGRRHVRAPPRLRRAVRRPPLQRVSDQVFLLLPAIIKLVTGYQFPYYPLGRETG